MSRIGNAPVVIPDGVDIKIDGHVITVKGPKGTLTRELHPDITAKQEDKEIIVTRPSDDKFHKAIHGTTRALIHNMVVGVSQGFEKKMEISSSSSCSSSSDRKPYRCDNICGGQRQHYQCIL